MSREKFDAVVIGSGPGGYVAAIRAAQLGNKVAVVEREQLGGICLNWGCIPTKVLLKSAEIYATLKQADKFGIKAENVTADFPSIIKRSRQVAARMSKGVQFLFNKNNISVFAGTGQLLTKNVVAIQNEAGEISNELEAKNVIIATGARPRSIPGIEIDKENIISSREAMSLAELPKSMIVIGAGAIGVEFAYFYQTMGCQVTLVEMMPTILPIEDREITALLSRSFKKNKMKILTSCHVKKIAVSDNRVTVNIEAEQAHSELEADLALMAIGVRGNFEELGIEKVGVITEKGYIKVNEYYQTSVENIYAIGDIIGPPWLAHVASAEGIRAAERISGIDVRPIDYSSIPGCTYCQPQIASIGLTEVKAVEQGFSLKIGRFPFVANGRSLAAGESEGIVKLIFDKQSNQLLGAHIIHAEATELIGELSVLKSLKIKSSDLVKTVHAHPTLSEAILEAAAAANNEAIHV